MAITGLEETQRLEQAELEKSRDFEIKKLELQHTNNALIKRIEADASIAHDKYRDRYKAIERIAVAICKMPFLIFPLIAACIMWVKNDELPESLEEFLTL